MTKPIAREERIRSIEEFNAFVARKIAEGLTDPVAIAKLAGERGAHCAAVAVQKVIAKLKGGVK